MPNGNSVVQEEATWTERSLHKPTGNADMHPREYFSIRHDDNTYKAITPKENSSLEFLCGWMAAFINITVTFPMNKLMFRQQLHGIKCWRAMKQLQNEGLVNLYRGLLPPLMQKTASVSLMFGLYDYFQKVIRSHNPSLSLPVTQGMAALLAGTTEAALTPFERVQTLLQDHRHMKNFNNTIHAFRVLRPYGIGEYYRGLTPILIRNGPSNICFFGLRGHFKSALPEPSSQIGHTINDFLSGAMLGAMLGTVFYPINVVKTRMQVRLGGRHQSTFRTLQVIWKERGRSMRRMFYGVQINFTRSLVSWGIINASYELIKKTFFS
ncbi:mitochondrial nicotinamide adenine dinucleotide transporter SLC25A51-like [Ptychodera flava]|uniref:mitochondrial nicotinamide adenine dinucleotide transporter SLC25A51-like n=1 Tax=Ptychodera flava TaxID=63121 RepID=UPI003969FE39